MCVTKECAFGALMILTVIYIIGKIWDIYDYFKFKG